MKDRAFSHGNIRRKEHKTQLCIPLSPVFTRDCGEELNFIDEPTIGLDAVSKLAVRGFIRRLNEEHKTTVILTTHDMQDIEALASRIILIGKGRVLMDGTLSDMRGCVENPQASLDEIVASLYHAYEI